MKTTEKQKTRKHFESFHSRDKRTFTSDQKIQIVVEFLQAKMPVAELCHKYCI